MSRVLPFWPISPLWRSSMSNSGCPFISSDVSMYGPMGPAVSKSLLLKGPSLNMISGISISLAEKSLSIVYPSDDFTLDKEMQKLKNLLNNGDVILAGGRSAHSYEDVLQKMGAKIITKTEEFRNELEKRRL